MAKKPAAKKRRGPTAPAKRKQDGRPKGYKTPDEVWKAFQLYRAHIEANPRLRQDFVGKDGNMVYKEIKRPLTVVGFKSWCYEHYADIHNYFDNPDGRYDEFKEIITRIKDIIQSEQVDGALTGDYNSNLTARLNGLVDKAEVTGNHNVKVINIDPLADS